MRDGDQDRPTWDVFRRYYIDPGNARVKALGGTDGELFVEPGAHRMGLRLKWSGTEDVVSPLAALVVARVERSNASWLELSTERRELYENFFYFLLNVADAVREGEKPPGAFQTAVTSWLEALKRASHLTDAEQLGLFGELWLLDRFMRAGGPEALQGWVGPAGERHDFRLGSTEFEVKTTVRPDRTHVVGHVKQLVPSEGCRLFIVSVRLEQAGALAEGVSLPMMVERARSQLASAPAQAASYERLLGRRRYRNEDAPAYATRYIHAEPPALVAVDASCPRLTPEILTQGLGELSRRITELNYSINVDGLGHLDGTVEFLRLIPQRKDHPK